MLSKNKIKYIRSLELKKKRKEEQVFVAEGHKLVGDLLGYFPCKLLIATSNWLKINHPVTANEIIEVTQEELSRASLQKTPQEVLAVFVQPFYDLNPEVIKSSLCLALDDVQDPGNLGTIIRLADWFGIEHIFCSAGTADVYNPKTVQATMGALARVKVHYCSLPQLIESLADIPVYGTDKQEVIHSQLSSRTGNLRIIECGNCHSSGLLGVQKTFITLKFIFPSAYPIISE